ncbi:hypothetical protein HanIR_Chr06g0266391 [Helianthus annuus]|nr:hypothetical protein HanIR_Chr06g0266391 [Helianthus annuus]KAJ0737126.1 hypothetical protein HanLR1_Chr06g0203521 [Helianthus annuus]
MACDRVLPRFSLVLPWGLLDRLAGSRISLFFCCICNFVCYLLLLKLLRPFSVYVLCVNKAGFLSWFCL